VTPRRQVAAPAAREFVEYSLKNIQRILHRVVLRAIDEKILA
jgi:hypothetical protein